MKSGYFALPALALPLLLAGCGSTRPAAANAPAPAPATLSTPKISPPLAAMARKVRAAPSGTAAAALSTRTMRVNEQREMQIYVYVRHMTSDIRDSIAAAGATEIRPSRPLGLYQAWATADAMAKIATLPGVYKIAAPVYGFSRPSNP